MKKIYKRDDQWQLTYDWGEDGLHNIEVFDPKNIPSAMDP